MKLIHRFVEVIPEQLETGIVYISLKYCIVVHLCPCGCKSEIFTPLGPTDWLLIFNGETISLRPSVGSWSLPCRSHYWITNNRICWANGWSNNKIKKERKQNTKLKKAYYKKYNSKHVSSNEKSVWSRFKNWFK